MADINRAVLAAGLDWLYRTRQPDDAIQQHHGITLPGLGNRYYGFCPEGADKRPVVSVNVARPKHRDTVTYELTNPIGPNELRALTTELHSLGVRVTCTWNGHPGPHGSLGLDRPAHPSLLAAVKRYHAGCPEHPDRSVFCDCDAWSAGHKRVIAPVIRYVSGGGRRFHTSVRCRALTSGQELWEWEPWDDYAPIVGSKPHRAMSEFEAIVRGYDPCRVCLPDRPLPFRVSPDCGHEQVEIIRNNPICGRCLVRWPCTTALVLNLTPREVPAHA